LPLIRENQRRTFEQGGAISGHKSPAQDPAAADSRRREGPRAGFLGAFRLSSATMASTVHYKFKSQKDYDSVGFDGMFISVGDLKKSIVEKKGLARDQACELLLTNAQNDEEYSDDATMVWKNTSVIVKRVPSHARRRGRLRAREHHAEEGCVRPPP
jgi:E3 ubiquitin-protein ligase RBBP6